MNHEPLRTNLILALVAAKAQRGDNDVADVYKVVDNVMKEETLRVYFKDVTALDAMITQLQSLANEEDYGTFKLAVAAFISGMAESKPRNAHMVALTLKVAEQVRYYKEMTPDAMMVAILTQFQRARNDTVRERDAVT
jgi:hypothetical protein